MQSTLRQALSGHMLDLLAGDVSLAEMQAIAHRVGRQMRSAGFTVQTPNVSCQRNAFDFILSQMRSVDRLPPSDRRHSEPVDIEVRTERSSINPYEKR